MSKVLIETKDTEFEQNRTDLALINTSFREGTSIMLSSDELKESISNASEDVKKKIGVNVEGTINITTNGTHDVSSYAEADVNVPAQTTTLPEGVTQGGVTISSNNLTQEVIDDLITWQSSYIGNVNIDYMFSGDYTDASSFNINAIKYYNFIGNGNNFIGVKLSCGNSIPPSVDFSACTEFSMMFSDSTITSFPNNYFNTMPVPITYPNASYVIVPPVKCNGMFRDCKNLTSVSFNNIAPIWTNNMFEGDYSLTSVTGINLQYSLSVNSMFKRCPLTTFAVNDISNATNVGSFFGGCFTLDDTGLDNVLQTLITGTRITRNKSLANVFGGTEPGSQQKIVIPYSFAERVRACEHYQACIDAGWRDGMPTEPNE